MQLHVFSFNIRYDTARDEENRWELRVPLVADLLRDQKPDVIGLQEALRRQIDAIRRALPELAESGVGRDDGKTAGEYSAILYRRDRLDAVEQGTFWFSDTPETPGSKSWGNTIPRICSWARLREKASGQTFYLYNCHLDHQSQPSRERSVQLLLERIRARKHPDPVILTGDFNADEDNPAIRALRASRAPELRDTFRILHPSATEVATFHTFRGGTRGGKIDFLFATPEWKTVSSEILHTNQAGRYPSDHFPVSATLRCPAE